MPRAVESTTSKLLRLIDDLSPDEIRFAQEILKHAAGKAKPTKVDGTGPKRRKRQQTPSADAGGQQ